VLGNGQLEVGDRRGDVSLCRGDETPATVNSLHSQRTLQAPRVHLVRLEVGTGAIELTERDQRLDRIRPERLGRVVHASCKQPLGKLAQVPAGRLQVAESQLEVPERAESEDGVRLGHGLRERDSLLGTGPRLVDQAQIGFDERPDACGPDASMLVLGLVGELVELGCRHRSAPGGCLLGSRFEVRRGNGVGAFGGEREVSGALLELGDDSRQY
jgi:hypothetical protein